MGAAGGHAVKVSEVNHVDAPLQEILDGGHAINVHLSAEEIGTYIACGNSAASCMNGKTARGRRSPSRSPSSTTPVMSGSPGSATMGRWHDVGVSLIEPEEME